MASIREVGYTSAGVARCKQVTPALGQAPSPEACAGLIAEGLASIVNAAYDIAQASSSIALQ